MSTESKQPNATDSIKIRVRLLTIESTDPKAALDAVKAAMPQISLAEKPRIPQTQLEARTPEVEQLETEATAQIGRALASANTPRKRSSTTTRLKKKRRTPKPPTAIARARRAFASAWNKLRKKGWKLFLELVAAVVEGMMRGRSS